MEDTITVLIYIHALFGSIGLITGTGSTPPRWQKYCNHGNVGHAGRRYADARGNATDAVTNG